jgi:Flp pilus assembly protein TadG
MKIQFPQGGRRKSGQILVLFALLLPVLFLMLGLCIDMGILYLKKAQMSKAADSVALRIGLSPSISTTRRQAISLSAAKANLPGFLENYTTWGTTTGTVSATGGETITIENAVGSTIKDKMTINTTGSSASSTPGVPTVEVVNTLVTIDSRQRTYFMMLMGQYYVDMTETAQAKRFPAIIAVVVDISGSMLEQGTTGTYPSSGARCDELLDSIQTFVEFFDEQRDFFLVTSYSRSGRVEWPPTPNTSVTGVPADTYWPSREFKSGISGVASTALSTYLNNNMLWMGSTNPYEGFRVAAKNVKALLDQYPQTVQDQIDVNYILMTDGEFNTYTAYVRGPGYGNQSVTNTNVGSASARPSWLASDLDFHLDAMLVGDFSSAVSAQLPSSQNSTSFTTYDLQSRMSSIPKTSGIPIGVRSIVGSNLQAFTGDDTGSGTSASKRQFNTYLNSTNGYVDSGSANYVVWPSATNITNYSSALPNWKNWSHTVTKVPIKVGSTVTYDEFGSDVAVSGVKYWGSSNATPTDEMKRDRAKYYNVSQLAICPATYVLDSQNPFQNSSSPRYADDPTHAVMTNAMMSTYPGMRFYANHYGMYSYETYAGYNSSNPRNGTREASNTHIPINKAAIGSVCMTDLYPDYAAGGFQNEATYWDNGTTLESGTSTPKQLQDVVDATGKAAWTHHWSMRSNAWNTATSDNDAYWLIQAQAWLVRSQQKARIFCIDYEGGSTNDMRRIANNNSGTAFTQYSTQKVGEYYNVQTLGQDGLEEAFEDIANRISLKLTK